MNRLIGNVEGSSQLPWRIRLIIRLGVSSRALGRAASIAWVICGATLIAGVCSCWLPIGCGNNRLFIVATGGAVITEWDVSPQQAAEWSLALGERSWPSRVSSYARSERELWVYGRNPVDRVFPCWLLLCLALTTSAMLQCLKSRGQYLERVRELGLCAYCGYDLRGNRSGRCPECGGALVDWTSAEWARHATPTRDRRVSLCMRYLVGFVLAFGLGVMLSRTGLYAKARVIEQLTLGAICALGPVSWLVHLVWGS